MKAKFYILVAGILISTLAFSQVYTPNGSLVPDTEVYPELLTSYDISDILQYMALTYPNAVILGSATSTYNCHAYAWHISEGGTPVWMGLSSNPTPIYWNDGSYIETTSRSNGLKVSYDSPPYGGSDNHSAITTTEEGIFISKWGSCPLVRHAKDYSPYTYTTLRYYKRNTSYPDLLIRDDFNDDGTEPNPLPVKWDASPDIWLQDQYFTRHLYASELVSGLNCYVCFNIKNIRNALSNPARLHLYWTKDALNPLWSQSWTGAAVTSTGLPLGGRITYLDGVIIPALAPNESYYSCYPWTVPNNASYTAPVVQRIVGGNNGSTNNWNYLFLARIADGNPVKHLNETTYNSALFAQENNNVVVNNADLIVSGMYYRPAFYIHPRWNPSTMNTLEINQYLTNGHYNNNGQTFPLRTFAELYINFSPAMFALLQCDNTEKDGFKIVDENRILITSDNTQLHFKPFTDMEDLYFVGTEVNFISDKMPELNEFQFELAYTDGGETARRTLKAVRNLDVYFKAQAEASKTKVVRAKEEVTLTSNVIYDDAYYVWYNEAGEKIGTGYQITLTPNASQTYKIEITKKEDGYKSYDEVSVMVVDGIIKSLSPNPAKSYVKVEYSLSNNATNTQIQISDLQHLVSIARPVSTTENSTEISLYGFASGNYIVKLIINGAVVDSQNLIIY